jgi:hypothetical protein
MSAKTSRKRSDQTANAVFLIGLAILLLPNGIGFWPGILFVIGASNLARAMSRGRAWYDVQGALWMIGLGFLFWFGFSLPVLLILVGLTMLFGYAVRPPFMARGCCADESPLEGDNVDDYVIEHKAKRKLKNEETGLEYYDPESDGEADYI